MDDPREPGFGSEELDPDAVLWVRGVDYVAGWREAKDAAAELADALTVAGIEATGVQARADASASGAGVVHLRLSAATVRDVAALVRDFATWRKAS
ncbi:hypothetical protein [Streptomyces sp. 7N604]|uniref:hypothetical protein n=1 Tax=Streptomyces sp. 7N604 TaxID=3457415 RepID=UPI003FD64984